MNKKRTISQASNKALLSLVYFLFFTVQLHFQYQSVSSVEFVDNSIVAQPTSTHNVSFKTEIKQDVSFTKHNRLNKRYHPEWPIAIVDFFEYHPVNFQPSKKQYFSVAADNYNIFLSTYLLRGPPSIC